MSTTTVGVYRESEPGERRVALTPPAVVRVREFGLDVVVETRAGDGAGFPDRDYRAAGALIVGHEQLLASADVLLCVSCPGVDASHRFRPGQILLGLLEPSRHARLLRHWAADRLTALSLDLVPPGLPGGHLVDAAASQDVVAGRRAALLALLHLDRPTPALCAPGEEEPPLIRALVVGARADGREAALTLARLGVASHLWWPGTASAEPVPGVVALHLPPGDPVSALVAALPAFDVVITALREAETAPLLLPEESVRTLLPGAVIVDLTADDVTGNVAGAAPDGIPRTIDGVTVIGAPDLAGGVPAAASAAYSRAVEAVLARLLESGRPRIDPTDPFQAATLVTHQGQVVHEATWRLILDDIRLAGCP